MSLTIVIPSSVPAADRRKALAKAKHDFHHAKMAVSRSIRSGDLMTYRHARKTLKRAREVVRAWSAVQRSGEAA